MWYYWVMLVALFALTYMLTIELDRNNYVRWALLVFGAMQLLAAFALIVRGLW